MGADKGGESLAPRMVIADDRRIQEPGSRTRVISPRSAFWITDILSDADTRALRAEVQVATSADSSDEVGLVDHACGLAAGDADEDALVQPVEVVGGGLDLG